MTRRPVLLPGFALLACGAGFGAANAADVQFDPYVELGYLYSDNFILERDPRLINAVSGAFVNAGAEVRASSPRSTWRLAPRVRSTEFPDDANFEATDYFIEGSGERRGERSLIGITGFYLDQNIVDNQLPDGSFGNPSLGEVSRPDSGRIVGPNRQSFARLRPFAQFDLSELTRLRVEAGVQDVSFDREILGAQVSYQGVGGLVALDRSFSPASRVGLRVEYEKVDLDVGAGDSDLAGVQVQWDYRIAERITAYVRGGARRSEFSLVPAPGRTAGTVSETTPLLAGGAQWNFLRSQLFLDLQRQVEANASGFIVSRDDVRLSYNYRFNARLRGYLSGYAIRDEAVSDTGVFVPRDYYSLVAGMEWRFLKAWAVTAEYERNSQQFGSDGVSGDGNNVRASIVYRPLRRD